MSMEGGNESKGEEGEDECEERDGWEKGECEGRDRMRGGG